MTLNDPGGTSVRVSKFCSDGEFDYEIKFPFLQTVGCL